MLTKYKLVIGSEDYELQEDDLKNWAEIKCVFKRADYGGVVRSFTSKFEFVNKAYKLIMNEFDRHGFKSQASVRLFVIDNNWEWHLEYQCDLDFSTLNYTERVLSINAFDNSAESIIKANKSTKYEFVVGDEVPVFGDEFLFERLKMIETATYEVTEGTSGDDGSLTGEYKTDMNYRLYTGLVNDELAVGQAVHLNDDQENGDGYMFSAIKTFDITLEYSIVAAYDIGCAPIQLMKNNTMVEQLHRGVGARPPWRYYDYPNIDAVMNEIRSNPGIHHDWAYESWRHDWVTVQGIVWEVETDSTGGNMWVNTGQTRDEYCRIANSGTATFKVFPGDKIWLKFASEKDCDFKIYSSSLKFSWQTKGAPVRIECIPPDELLERILAKMGVFLEGVISDYDKRLARTLILPAESIRAIPGAKIYVSFNDFCKWIEAVFGYTYVINEEYGLLEFKHRNEIFSSTAPLIDIDNATDFSYKIDNSVLYSSVVVGYDKKDYDSVNGRDEFNFNSTYTTEYPISGKKLELKSPFRADSYGIEFLVEKRGESTTDNASDKDIFFVQGRSVGNVFKASNECKIENSLTGTLFNGEFSPMHCAGRNRDYISIMDNTMVLKYASTEGNADIVIDNVGMNDNLWLEDCEMLTAGELKFTTYDQRVPMDLNSRIRVKSEDFIYEGFIRQVSFMLARPEAVEYTIMIKSKTPCS